MHTCVFKESSFLLTCQCFPFTKRFVGLFFLVIIVLMLTIVSNPNIFNHALTYIILCTRLHDVKGAVSEVKSTWYSAS